MTTLVQTHPQLIKFLGSKNPLWVALFALPLVVIFALSTPLSLIGLVGIVGGFLYWSLFEYLVHRFPYHTHFRHPKVRWFIESFHLYHHRVREDKRVLNSGPLMLYPLAVLLLAPLLLAGMNLATVAAVGLGLVLYYVFYECIHYLIHQRVYSTGYLAYIQKFHLYHHDKAWSKNFGNTLPLWDLVFKTYDPRFKQHEITRL